MLALWQLGAYPPLLAVHGSAVLRIHETNITCVWRGVDGRCGMVGAKVFRDQVRTCSPAAWLQNLGVPRMGDSSLPVPLGWFLVG